MGFIKPKSGKCTIDGLDCWSDRDKVQARLGYIPGEISFFDDMSGTQFLRFITEYRKIDTRNRMEELLERFELDPKMSQTEFIRQALTKSRTQPVITVSPNTTPLYAPTRTSITTAATSMCIS